MRNLLLLTCVVGVGCGGTSGANPHDMGVNQHAEVAASHDRIAEQHEAQFDPDATALRERCALRGDGPSGGSDGSSHGGDLYHFDSDVCWTSVINPTEEHRRDAEEHRRHAEDHRAASMTLGEAEARACVGVSPSDRDASPFMHVDDIVAVDRTETGATLTFREVPGLSAQRLRQLIDCHLARNASLGHSMPDMPDCPLVPRGVEARVQTTNRGLAVTIWSDDQAVARVIQERVERLSAR